MQLKAEVPGRILVIDDEMTVRVLFERVLVGAGHEVTLVETGEDGLQEIARRPFDLLIADKNLPGIDGLEVLRLARSQYPGLQAIMVTAYHNPDAEQEARRLGVYSYVTKPFGILEIVGACDGAIRLARSGSTPQVAAAT
jgi:CheY-like chemotaxis protein